MPDACPIDGKEHAWAECEACGENGEYYFECEKCRKHIEPREVENA